MSHEAAFDKSLNAKNYGLLRDLLKQVSGLNLTDNKMYLVETRLQSVAKAYGVQSLDALVDLLKGPKSQRVRVDIAEAMATPETFFFRDKKPFDLLEKHIIPDVIAQKGNSKRLRIWSAACSSGQEPYSIAMIVDGLKSTLLSGWDVDIIATDFSQKILKRASEGIYSQFEVQRGLPVQLLMKHFKQAGTQWKVRNSLKRLVQFKAHNLLQKPVTLGTFDILFCRNVLFYFDAVDKKKILEQLSQVCEPHANLLLGAAESTHGFSNAFKVHPEHRGLFIKA